MLHLKKVNENKLRFKKSLGLLLISKSQALLKTNYLTNSSIKKIHKQHKTYRYIRSTLLKQSKLIYYVKYFVNNWNNIKNTCKGIKTIISIKNIITEVPHSIEFNNRTITDPTAMSNIFNSYFTSIAKKINSNIKF